MEWNDYFWPGTTVLRNHLGIRDAGDLERLEHHFAYSRWMELARGQAPVSETFDAEHLRGVHRWLFQDV